MALGSLSWHTNINSVRKRLNEITKKYDNTAYSKLIKYYTDNWLERLVSGSIDYSDVEDELRANSVLENYNRHVKDNLPRAAGWPKFIDFLRSEEAAYVDESFSLEQRGQIALKSVNLGKTYLPKALKDSKQKKDQRATLNYTEILPKENKPASKTIRRRNPEKFTESQVVEPDTANIGSKLASKRGNRKVPEQVVELNVVKLDTSSIEGKSAFKKGKRKEPENIIEPHVVEPIKPVLKKPKKTAAKLENLKEVTPSPVKLNSLLDKYKSPKRQPGSTLKSSHLSYVNNLTLEIPWFLWHANSCRYDAFLTVFTFNLLRKYPDFKPENADKRHRHCQAYYDLCSTAEFLAIARDSNHRREIASNFWNMMFKSKIDNNKPGAQGCVTELLQLFAPLLSLHPFIESYTKCSFCLHTETKRQRLSIPISIQDISDLKLNSLQEYVHWYFSKRVTTCDLCLQETVESGYQDVIELPDLLVLEFISTEENLFKKDRKFKFNLELKGSNPESNFKLISTINVPFNNHFSCALYEPQINEAQSYQGKWILHDGLKWGGKLKEVTTFNHVLNQKPFLFFYRKV